MRNIYLGFKFAFSYFSILPINFKQTDDLSEPKILSSMLFFFPIVGIFLGLITLLAYIFLLQPLGVAGAVISAVLYMIFYGFIHTEAIADVADAMYAKHSGKNPYEIIKEPTIGAMGLLYTVAFVVTKIAIVSFLLLNAMFFEFLAITLISRFSLLILIKIYDFKSTFVTLLKNALSTKAVILSSLSVCVIGFLSLGLLFLPLFIVGVILSSLIAKLIGDKLGFQNGDVLGSSLELTEVLLFTGVSLCL